MQLYFYDSAGCYTASREARALPGRESMNDQDLAKWQRPANSTFDAPPNYESGEVPLFVDGEWIVVPDHRGETWWSGFENPVTVEAPGDPSTFSPPLVPNEPEPNIATLVDRLKSAAWSEALSRMEGGSVSVTTAAGTHSYGVDGETRENLAGLAQIVAQIKIGNLPQTACPDPRPFTPKGELQPINLTNADIVLVAASVAAGKDTIMAAYLQHKAYIADPARTVQELMAYDVSAGWPL